MKNEVVTNASHIKALDLARMPRCDNQYCFTEQNSGALVYGQCARNILGNDAMFAMKWYYKYKLNKIEAEIEALKKTTGHALVDNYTDHLRLRSLNRLAEYLRERLARQS